MSLSGKLVQTYFNLVYNRLYDFSTARLNRYQRLHATCIGRLNFEDNDRVLCVGLGTGNEVFHILQRNRNVNIVGVDFSGTGLRKAYKKALKLGSKIEILFMDARHLEFPAESFDKVVCLHVMDFIHDDKVATTEIFRVLKNGGQFVITYPSHKEGPGLGVNLLTDHFRHALDSKRHRLVALFQGVAQVLVGIGYLPLIFRSKKSYSRSELEAMMLQFSLADYEIDEDPVYQDFIIYGRKSTKGGKSNAC